MSVEIICSDALTALRTLPADHFHFPEGQMELRL